MYKRELQMICRRERERYRERDTEREREIQRDRETERQRDTEKEREREREEQKQSNFKNIPITPEKNSVVTLVTNFHKLSLLPLVVRP